MAKQQKPESPNPLSPNMTAFEPNMAAFEAATYVPEIEEVTELRPAQASQAAIAHLNERDLPPAPANEPPRPNYTDGKGMRELKVKRLTKVQEAHLAGVVPFTVANFNPVKARVECGIIDYSIPEAGGKVGLQKRLKIGGIERACAILTIDKLKGYSKPTQASDTTGNPNDPEVSYDWNVVQPIRQAREFDWQYNNPTDDMRMGGVLVFRGDWNTLVKAAEGKDGGIIQVPATRRAPNGDLLYSTRPVALIDRITEILEAQKAYCLRKIQTAREYADDPRPEFKASIDVTHKTWAQFAVDRGWTDQYQVEFLSLRKAGAPCPRCGKARASGMAMFCVCGRPYDAYAAFMAGEKVDHEYLVTLPAEQLEAVKKEAQRRRELAELLSPQSPKASN